MKDPNVGDTLAYFSEGNAAGEPYAGPYPARVIAVSPAKPAVEHRDADKRKPAEPLLVDLKVKFSDGPIEHSKTGVRVTDQPEKHCCTASPYSFDFDSWFQELDALERKKSEAEQAKVFDET